MDWIKSIGIVNRLCYVYQLAVMTNDDNRRKQGIRFAFKLIENETKRKQWQIVHRDLSDDFVQSNFILYQQTLMHINA